MPYKSNEARRTWFRERKRKLVDLAGGACVRCGYDKSLAALGFHHRDPASKTFQIGSGGRPWEELVEEVAKCDLLCANCHAEAHVI